MREIRLLVRIEKKEKEGKGKGVLLINGFRERGGRGIIIQGSSKRASFSR